MYHPQHDDVHIFARKRAISSTIAVYLRPVSTRMYRISLKRIMPSPCT